MIKPYQIVVSKRTGSKFVVVNSVPYVDAVGVKCLRVVPIDKMSDYMKPDRPYWGYNQTNSWSFPVKELTITSEIYTGEVDDGIKDPWGKGT